MWVTAASYRHTDTLLKLCISGVVKELITLMHVAITNTKDRMSHHIINYIN